MGNQWLDDVPPFPKRRPSRFLPRSLGRLMTLVALSGLAFAALAPRPGAGTARPNVPGPFRLRFAPPANPTYSVEALPFPDERMVSPAPEGIDDRIVFRAPEGIDDGMIVPVERLSPRVMTAPSTSHPTRR